MGTKMTICSSLEKVFSTDRAFPPKLNTISLLSGQKGNLQLCIKCDKRCRARLTIKSDLKINTYTVQEIYSASPFVNGCDNTAVVNGAKKGFYPDLLTVCSDEIELINGKNLVLWLEIDTKNALAGEYDLSISLKAENELINSSSIVKILDKKMPEQRLIHINWFHADCILSRYKTQAFDEKHWELLKNYIKNAADHGINCLYTPLFTPPLDTEVGYERPTVQLVGVTKNGSSYSFNFDKLLRWINTAKECGIKYFELSHLFTQWGAKHAPKIIATENGEEKRIFGWDTDAKSSEYQSFLAQFGKELTAFTNKQGITKLCFVHCSDEPGANDIEDYRAAAAVIKEHFGSYKHIDALSDFEFYKSGLVETPVPEEGNIEAFAGKVPELWTYYCCGHYFNNLPNRFFALPSIKNRILGVLLYKYNCTGFLQWGYNFWYSQYSRSLIDPYRVTDAQKAFPSGDAFIVYPGADGNPESSLRQKVFFDGLQDNTVLYALQEATSREYVLNLIKKHLGDISFTNYPLENETYLNFIEAVCAELEAK